MKSHGSGITRRWIVNTFGIIVLVLVIFNVLCSYALKQYYYKIAESSIDSRVSVSSMQNFFSAYTGSTDNVFENGAREFVENFSYSNLMEVWVINPKGSAVVSSTGFPVEQTKMPDFETAKRSDDGEGTWIGKYSTGEKVLAKTFLLPSNGNDFGGAVRFIISLSGLNRQHVIYTALISFACIVALFFVSISGLYFIKSIVNPVKKINESAKKLAAGDFNAKIDDYNNDDEIGELCETFNYMSDEIARTDRIKNDFISTVSHELRTPLTAIKGWGETLMSMGTEDKEITEKALGVIVNETDRLYSLVEELLDFSKIQSGRLSLRLEPIDVLAELDEAVFVFMDRAKRDGIELSYSSPDYTAPMSADSARIKQVFVNVLDNAFKYNKQGGKVSVCAHKTADNNIVIEITDTGCGISKEDLSHVKEKFYKANVSVRGSGIGLAVVDEIIKMHNGTLDIASEENVGTRVTMILPLSPESEKQNTDERKNI